MPAASYNIHIEQGSTYLQTFIWKDSVGSPISLVGYTARMQIRPSIKSATVLIELTTENSGISFGGEMGTVEVNISATQTASLSVSGVYDLELIQGSVISRFISGNVYLSEEVTR